MFFFMFIGYVFVYLRRPWRPGGGWREGGKSWEGKEEEEVEAGGLLAASQEPPERGHTPKHDVFSRENNDSGRSHFLRIRLKFTKVNITVKCKYIHLVSTSWGATDHSRSLSVPWKVVHIALALWIPVCITNI